MKPKILVSRVTLKSLPVDQTRKSDFSRKGLFNLLKKSKQESQGIALRKAGESTVTANADKINVLNRQF